MAAVLEAIKGFLEIYKDLKELVAVYRQARSEGWIQEGKEIIKVVAGAKTDEERKELVRKLNEHRASPPSL